MQAMMDMTANYKCKRRRLNWVCWSSFLAVRLDVWMFGCLDVWMFGCLDHQVNVRDHVQNHHHQQQEEVRLGTAWEKVESTSCIMHIMIPYHYIGVLE